MRFLVNKRGTKIWSEIPAETLIDWSKDEGKEREKLTKDWIKKTRHGEIYVFGVNYILSVDVPE